MKKKKLYISLPISGFSLNAVALEAESYKLMWEEEGFEVVTPFDLSPDSEKPYSYHMGKDIEGLLECDAVYFAPGWVDSKEISVDNVFWFIRYIELGYDCKHEVMKENIFDAIINMIDWLIANVHFNKEYYNEEDNVQ